MPEVKIRKSLIGVEDIFHERGPVAASRTGGVSSSR
jgi:hypothetical protein